MLSIPNGALVCVCALLCVSVMCVCSCGNSVCACMHVCTASDPWASSRGCLLWSPLMDAQLESSTHKGGQGRSRCPVGPFHLAELSSRQSALLCVWFFLCIYVHLCFFIWMHIVYMCLIFYFSMYLCECVCALKRRSKKGTSLVKTHTLVLHTDMAKILHIISCKLTRIII